MNVCRLTSIFALLVTSAAVVIDDDFLSSNRRGLQDDLELDPEPDVWIVELRPGTRGQGLSMKEEAEQMVRGNEGSVGFVYEHVLEGFVFHGKNIEGLARNPNVLSITRDSVLKVTSQSTPTGIKRVYAPAKQYMERASTTCFCDAVVAVIDTGVDFDHPDLKVNKAKSVDCTIGCVQGRGNDVYGHGTHVAGTIAAVDNGRDVVGVCPGAEIWAIKVLSDDGSGYDSWVLAGIDYVARNGAVIDVANMSLGGPDCKSTLCNAITRATEAGVAFAVAAGNSNEPASQFSPACCSDALTVSALADYDGKAGALASPTCGSSAGDDSLATFSNYGRSVDIAAPGACIKSTIPGGRMAVYSGTSMAAPHVAGALAVLASNNHNGDVITMYETLTSNGNFGFKDKPNDAYKEPLLDLRKLPNARMVGTCESTSTTGTLCRPVLSTCRRSQQCCAGLSCRIRQGRTRGKCVSA